MKWLCAAIPLVVSGLCMGEARAQPTAGDLALAESLFREARTLFEQGDFARACPKFAESHRLDPAGGTLLNLAACHQADGKLASAWAEYQEAMAWARREGNDQRLEVARARVAQLEPRLARVAVVVSDAARLPGLVVDLDTTRLAEAAWGVATPIDPGRHVVRVAAPGHAEQAVEVSVSEEGLTQTIDVPVLEPLAEAPPAPVPVAAPLEPQSRSGLSTQPALLPERDGGPTSGPPLASWVAGGVGLLAVGVGSTFGWMALDKMRASDDECPGGACTARGAALSRDANDAANVANVAFGIGLVAAATGITLWVLDAGATKTTAAKRGWTIAPEVGRQSGAMVLGGVF